ncbi:MAG TPA: methyltransferase domain-containing protein [Gemmatimonadaceae bacterium]|nr:methyltransferase domain-containing protein [Gemmatimonadaceae bacterium]
MVQRAVLGRWRATGEELYREVAALTGAAPGREIVVSGCGDGATTEWLARRTGAAVTGVDPVRAHVEHAEMRARGLTVPIPPQYEQAPLDDLPHESGVFDAAIGEPMLSAAGDPARAVAELARVTKPMGNVVLLQLTWSSDIPPEARNGVVERLGVRPFLLVEWKQMLRDAGIVDLQVQDWTTGADGGEAGEPSPETLLTWREKMHIVGRAWRSRGWRAARGAVASEQALLRELSRERALGFALLSGVKWPHERDAA